MNWWVCSIKWISLRWRVPRFTERVWRELAKAKFEIGGFWYLWPVPPAPGCGHGGGHGRCPGHAGRFKCPKKRPGEASAKPLRDSCEPRPQIGENLDICIYGFPQTGVSPTRNDYFSALGISVEFWSSKAVVSCARNTHFLKNVKK